MKMLLHRVILTTLALTGALQTVARPLRFRLELWKEAPASYVLETSNYQASALMVKKRRTIDITIDERPGKTIVFFKPSLRQVVETSIPTLRQADAYEDFVDAFLLKHPITMTFNRDNSIELNLQKNLQSVAAFHQGYCEPLPKDSPLWLLTAEEARAMVDMNSQILLGLFINQLVFSTEFEEGRFMYRFPETEPIREAIFELQSTLYGFTLQGEAFVLDSRGKPLTKNTYQFDFSQELDVLERVSLDISSLEGDVRTVFVLMRKNAANP